jgi:hypothetical protein
MFVENFKWGVIAAGIWFVLYQVATVLGVTPLFWHFRTTMKFL